MVITYEILINQICIKYKILHLKTFFPKRKLNYQL